ncbi:MAG TPA: hypothetical protein PK733_00835 [Clostridiales bacterium]|nr:hypothetical protein [Clostridiales bacterium]
MELYFHVYELTREKLCCFKFYYYKNDCTSSIYGDVRVEYDEGRRKTASFDPKSDLLLSGKEKDSIVAGVLKNVYI